MAFIIQIIKDNKYCQNAKEVFVQDKNKHLWPLTHIGFGRYKSSDACSLREGDLWIDGVLCPAVNNGSTIDFIHP